ncbi:serine hydrolase domain-containing protein [Pseudohongiella sp.]|uniref:Beta-lactamase-related domain-containing protein n=1 Tax=marine sediment metagenome TaxID=412755 RepID=A0A0F9YF61_9ZZZZ|nr:serine hydrolase domain-containing protein [Pseudohongiella sp.]HDZ08410.1 class A beta-lactamase-related serine hydrolase [Pseudohongiella sp.]HEA62775.1 class A beta-lactamase-related serine hydrolase [Pseudohongiella sp.]
MRFKHLRSALALATASLVLAAQVSAQELSYGSPESVGMSAERLERIAPVLQQYVDSGELVGVVSMLARRGEVVHFEEFGDLNKSTGQALATDSIFRIYSMTKPITTMAVMMLYEEGKLQLNDPVARYLPEFADVRVAGPGGSLVAPQRPMTVQMLMTHSAGLTYGVFGDTMIDRQYRDAGVMTSPDLDVFIERLGQIPLQYQPGTRFHYSVATDVLGAVVEAVSGQSLGEFFQQRIFGPLEMQDTFFQVPADKLNRFGTNHTFDPQSGELVVSDAPSASNFVNRQTFESGGGGLLSTAEDYMKFSQMVLNGGELDGVRIIGNKTLEYMTQNHLPGIFGDNGQHAPDTLPGFVDGTGFGLGFAVIEDPTAAGGIGSKGEYYWGGAAGTIFWIDPVEELIGVVMIQHMNVQVPLRATFKALAYGAIID